MLSLAISLSHLFCLSPLKIIIADTAYYVAVVYSHLFLIITLWARYYYFFQRKKGEEINIQHGQVSCSISYSRYLMEWDSDIGLTTTQTFIFNYAILFLLTQDLSVQGPGQIHFLFNAFLYHYRLKLPVLPTMGIICNVICFKCVFTRMWTLQGQ